MALYIVSYDLRKKRDYPAIWKALETAGAVKLLESLWLLDVPLSATAVRDKFGAEMDADDGIAIVQIDSTGYWATRGVLSEGRDWLKQKIK